MSSVSSLRFRRDFSVAPGELAASGKRANALHPLNVSELLWHVRRSFGNKPEDEKIAPKLRKGIKMDAQDQAVYFFIGCMALFIILGRWS
jgi:hypothetical protein